MARLPSDADLGPLPSAESYRQVASFDASGFARGAAAEAAGAEAIGKGITSAGRDLAVIAHTQQSNTDTLDTAKADSQYLVQTKNLRDQLSNEKDATGLDEKYKPLFEAARDDAAKLITNPRQQQLFLLKRNPDVEGNILATGDKAFAIGKDQAIADANTQLEANRQAALRTQDPQARAEFIQAGHKLIAGLEDARYIDASKAQQLRQNWTENYATSAVQILPPEQQINLLRESPQGKDAVLDRIGGIENATGNPAERSKTSSAMGNFQFINQTWLDTVRAHRPDLFDGRSDKEVLALRADPKLSREMAGYLLDENAATLRSNGLTPNPQNLYLAHFLGAQGAVNVLKAAPGTPVADVIEEKAIGANRAVLAGKTVDSVIDWAGRKMGGTSRGNGNLIDFIPEDKRVTLLQRAQVALLNQNQQSDSEAALETYTVKAKIKDDLASTLNTGTGTDLDPERVRAVVGSKGLAEWQAAREDAHAVYVGSHGLGTMTDQQIDDRMRLLAPKAGDADYARKQTVYNAVQENVDQVRKRRLEDPALSVEDDPAVKSAKAAISTAALHPEAAAGAQQNYYNAVLAAQARAGVPEDAQSPITKDRALALTAPLRRMLPGQEREVLSDLAEQFKTEFGPKADMAFEYAMRANKMSAEATQVAVRVMKKLALGETPDPSDAKRLDQKAEISAADKAVAGMTNAPPPFDYGPGGLVSDTVGDLKQRQTQAPVAPREGVNVPPAAVTYLLQHPETAGKFDATFGKGNAKKVLDIYGKKP